MSRREIAVELESKRFVKPHEILAIVGELATPKPIRIRQLYCLQLESEEIHGEYHLESKRAGDSTRRIIGHASELFAIAAAEHEDETDPYVVTRIATPEFSFYSSKPLNEAQLLEIMNALTECAKMHPDNIHLSLGTLAVKIKGCVYNIALYINGGEHAKVHVNFKLTPWRADPSYRWERLFKLPAGDSHAILSLSDGTDHDNSPAIMPVADGQLQVFTVICLDHHLQRGIEFTERAASKKEIPLSSSSDYLITSATILPAMGPIPTTRHSHADFAETRRLSNFGEDTARHIVSPARFGARSVVYNLGVKPVGELIPDVEKKRRRSNQLQLGERLGGFVTITALSEAIETALASNEIDNALALLQYTPELPEALLERLAAIALDRLPCLELYQAIEDGHIDFNEANIAILVARAQDIPVHHQEQVMQWLIDHGAPAEQLNQYIEKVDYIEIKQITLLLTKADLHDKLTPASLNRITYILEFRGNKVTMNRLAPHFERLSPRAQLIVKKYQEILDDDNQALVGAAAEAPRPI